MNTPAASSDAPEPTVNHVPASLEATPDRLVRVTKATARATAAFARGHPTVKGLVAIGIGTIAAIGISFDLSPVANGQLATGAAVAVAVLGLSLLTGWSGQVSLGNSGFVLVGAYTVAIWAQHHGHTPIVASLALAAVTGAVAGAVLGAPATRLRGPYLAGMTIAFAVVLPTFIVNLSSISNGYSGLALNPTLAPTWFVNLFSGQYAFQVANQQWQTDCIILVAAVGFFFMGNLFRSKTGRAMRLVRDNEVAAELSGVNLARTRMLAFSISAAYASVAGALLAITAGTVLPQEYEFSFSIVLLTVMVLGGMGTLSGAVLAGVIYAFSSTFVTWLNGHIGISQSSSLYTQMPSILYAALLIIAMLFAPRGLAGLGGVVKRLGVASLSRRRVK